MLQRVWRRRKRVRRYGDDDRNRDVGAQLKQSVFVVENRPRSSSSRRVTVVAVVIGVVLAGGVEALAHLSPRQTPGSRIVPDGPTFQQALASVNGTVQQANGGPWLLFSVYGIEAQVPFSPNVLGYFATNNTANSCGRLFNGVTVWNGTIPVFNGTFNSGTAPFWQFGFYSNTSVEFLVATNVLGVPHVYPPFNAKTIATTPGACHPWYDFVWNSTLPSPSYWISQLETPHVDSQIASGIAVSATDQKFFSEYTPMVEMITLGPGMFQILGDVTMGYYGVYFERCGLPGVGGVQPFVQWAVSPNGTSLTNGGLTDLTENCGYLYQCPPGYCSPSYEFMYSFVFSKASQSSLSTTTQVAVPYQIAAVHDNGTGINDYDAVGLANWMTSWNLTSLSGEHLPLAASGCDVWAPISACTATSSGWYLVLTSPTGRWLDSYGQTSAGPSWSVPVTGLVSNQHLVLVVPSSWNVTGDALGVNSTEFPTTQVVGTVTL